MRRRRTNHRTPANRPSLWRWPSGRCWELLIQLGIALVALARQIIERYDR